jgi:hypothetical protein
MIALIGSVRVLINDSAGPGQHFDDQTIQDVMDESRIDVRNQVLKATPTFSGSTIQYLDYFSELAGWEDGYVLKQYLITPVTPSLLEPIAGHWQFATSTLPPVYISGSLHDRYRAAADLLERMAAQWVLRYNMTVDGQNLQRGMVTKALQDLAHTYRMKQRTGAIHVSRTDVNVPSTAVSTGLQATALDYMASGNGR